MKYPTLRARVLPVPGSTPRVKVDTESLHRIRKAFDLAESSPFQEAAAIKLAHRLMQKHNISRADVYENAKTPEERAQLRGESVVQIERNDMCEIWAGKSVSKRLAVQGWYNVVAKAMSVIFDCKFYTTNYTMKGHIHFVFGGIAANASMAAEAFEIALNTALTLALAVDGNKQDFYIGFGDGLWHNAREQRKQEADEVRKADLEQHQRDKEISRIVAGRGEEAFLDPPHRRKLEEDNGLDKEADRSTKWFNFDGESDHEAEISGAAIHIEEDGSARTAASLEMEFEALINGATETQKRDDGGWKSQQQLMLFRKNASEIASEWAAGKKLKKGHRSTASVKDHNVYRAGRAEGAEHDVKRRRLSYRKRQSNSGKPLLR